MMSNGMRGRPRKTQVPPAPAAAVRAVLAHYRTAEARQDRTRKRLLVHDILLREDARRMTYKDADAYYDSDARYSKLRDAYVETVNTAQTLWYQLAKLGYAPAVESLTGGRDE